MTLFFTRLRMKRLSSVVLLILFLAPLTAQEPEGIESVTYLPRTFYVGDVVEMRLELLGRAPGEFVIPEVFPEADWFLFRQVTVQAAGEGSILRILFSSYQPGIRLMPAVDLGAITLKGIRVDTSSLLEREKGGLAGTADPLFLPKTGLYFGLVVGVFFGVPLILILLVREFGSRWFRPSSTPAAAVPTNGSPGSSKSWTGRSSTGTATSSIPPSPKN